jgi:hypothetical protein
VVVPDGEGEHAPQARQPRDALLREEGQDDLCVAVAAEGVVARQLGADVPVVVDLPVEDDLVAAVRGGHRLEAGVGRSMMASRR